MKKCLTIFFLLSVLVFSFNITSSATAPFQVNINTDTGLQIYYPSFEAVKYNQSFEIHLHVNNISNGVRIPNADVDCYLHLYNSSGKHILESPAFDKDANGIDLEYGIGAGNFTEEGKINVFYIWCNITAQNLGGATKGFYEITGNGKPTPSGIIILGFSLLLLLVFTTVTVYLIKAVGTIIEGDFDMLDIAYAWGIYFGLLGLDLLTNIYLGNLTIMNWTGLFVKILAFPMIVIPVLAFFLSLFRAKKKQKEERNEW